MYLRSVRVFRSKEEKVYFETLVCRHIETPLMPKCMCGIAYWTMGLVKINGLCLCRAQPFHCANNGSSLFKNFSVSFLLKYAQRELCHV